ncbi:Fe-S cluster assembly protein SufD [Robiginitomaculum antarcticum]|uniref:Fe-S cluster assembly protein SufD n=1 Tax=Robiginitomaculum antarcticum TaxID=437507 RepID=UPI00039A1DEE|nr:Fe-S cluster assembly protein SufD [Robiginitomaculum antarcticum]
MPHNTTAEQRLGSPLPSKRDEVWKWTDLRRAVTDKAGGLTSAARPKFDLPHGVKIREGEGPEKQSKKYGHGTMAALAKSFGGKSWEIYVPSGLRPAAPLVISDIARGHCRIMIMVDKGAHIHLFEHYGGEQGGFTNSDIQIHLAEGAKLTRTIIQDDPADHCRIANAHIAIEEGAKLTQHCLAFGGGLVRMETNLTSEGEGVTADMGAAYLLSGERHCDMTSVIRLAHPNCTIDQAVKGVVDDKTRGVFQGKFLVERAAQHTDAQMRHDALMLSDRAQVRAKPELEIYADDVACEHGNTLGQLDETSLFYMRQRGIPIAQARAMLTEAFVSSVFDSVEDDDLRESLLVKVREWLEAR